MNNTLISNKTASLWYVISGFVGLVLTTIIAVEKSRVTSDKNYSPTCDIGSGEVFSCRNVMLSDQASVFGFSNVYIGFVGFTLLMLFGILIASYASQNKSTILLDNAVLTGMTLAFVFSIWLSYQAAVVIGSLCFYCMGVWAVVGIAFALAISKRLNFEWSKMIILSLLTIIIFTLIVVLGMF